jgi:hypothetical protein
MGKRKNVGKYLAGLRTKLARRMERQTGVVEIEYRSE